MVCVLSSDDAETTSSCGQCASHVSRTLSMAVASGPAGPVLARPVFTVIETAHAQIMNTEFYVHNVDIGLSMAVEHTHVYRNYLFRTCALV